MMLLYMQIDMHSIYVYMYVRMYVCMYICMHVCMSVRMYVYVHVGLLASCMYANYSNQIRTKFTSQ